MSRIFAVGDIHGCAATLEKLLWQELRITRQDKIYFLGDYIDRGPASREVVELILGLQRKKYDIHILRGNHEQLFMDSENSFESFNDWLLNGGVETLDSFEVIRFSQLK